MRHPDNQPRRGHARVATLSGPPADAQRRRAASARGSSLADRLAFLRGFLRHPDQVGSVIASSAQLEQRLARAARVAEARTVVELGPGTGGTTRAFLQALRPQAQLLAIELSDVFHARLRATIRDARLIVQQGSAEQIGEFMRDHGLPAPDAVISGIPFSSMPLAVGDRIAAAVAQVLAPGGVFVAYQVRPRVARCMTPYLGQPATQWEFINLPPMRVFTWTKAAA